ncbi:hypothetical protein CPC16_007604 [Podila verticillata]|nr:hypothetical protein CPC16_007604 [Podila verticillata]
MGFLLAPRAAPDEEPTSPSTGAGSGTCGLMSTFAIFVQLLLATIAFSTLIFKRSKERPMRPIKIWLYDVSKQIVGGVVIHSLNLLAATAFGLSSEREDSNPCIWYFLNIFLDTTFGVGVLYLFLKGADKYFQHMRIEGLRTGEYGNPPQIQRWWKQTLVFSLGLVVMKIVVVIVLTWPFLFTFGEWVLGWTLQNEKLQILFVMLILPLSMNICQFWVIDYILKQKTTEKFPIRIDDDEEDLYGLVGGLEHNSDDDEDDRHIVIVEGLIILNEIIVKEEERAQDRPYMPTPAPSPTISITGNAPATLDSDPEAVEYKPIGTPTSVSSPQESSPAPYQLQKKREAASEIIRFAGAMIRVTSTVITRAIHFWRLSFVVQPVSNIAFKAYALACL